MKENNLNVLITGASRGIGLAITRKLARRCKNLFLTSKNKDSCLSIFNEVNTDKTKAFYENFDHKFPMDAADGICSWVNAHVEYLDAVILDAGMFVESELSNISSEDFIENFNVNFIANHYIIQKLLPLLRKAYSPRVIIIGSTAAYRSYSVPSYSVAKWSLRGYAINLRKELSGQNIGVTFISPGGTLTDMWAGEELPENRLLAPNDIAEVVNTVFELSDQAVIDEIIVKPMLGDIDE